LSRASRAIRFPCSSSERAPDRRRVVEVAGDDLRPELRHRLGRVAVRLPRHRAQLEPAVLGEVSNGRSPLLAGRAGHQDQLFVGHVVNPFASAADL